MFVEIKTNGATEIYIAIPNDSASTSLPAISSMLETNAIFFKKGWSEASIVKPEMCIRLGDVVSFELRDQADFTIQVPKSENVLDESFTLMTPEVLVSNKKAMSKKEEELVRVKNLLAVEAAKVSELTARLKELLEEKDTNESE